uniref:R-spondin-2-like n=1 Tax=Myxine glutinosa TaxID=7769 RepID=UPI00358E2634
MCCTSRCSAVSAPRRRPYRTTRPNMHLRSLWTFLVTAACCLEFVQSRGASAHAHQSPPGQHCIGGCSQCSESNGCIRCMPRYFFHLHRQEMRQVGTCQPACPAGYYGSRGREMNVCIRCRIDHCKSCFSSTFCTKCLVGYYLHNGRCYEVCPLGYYGSNHTSECVVFPCMLSPWGEWSTCKQKGQTCGFKWGKQKRGRIVSQVTTTETPLCPEAQQWQRCRLEERFCPGQGGRKQKGRRKKSKTKKVKARNRLYTSRRNHRARNREKRPSQMPDTK